MGIYGFFPFFFKRYGHHITEVFDKNGVLMIKEKPIDILFLDVNGMFHNASQKIYKYGNFKQNKSLIGCERPKTVPDEVAVFREVCNSISKTMRWIQPKKRLVLCADGCVPRSKQVQQRQRRFKSAKDKPENFDPNSISVGTIYMDRMTKYISNFIKREQPNWNIDVIFSNEKVAGEGEHKAMNYIRKFGKTEESYCVYSNDADLLMLTMAAKAQKSAGEIFVLREDIVRKTHYIDIGSIAKEIGNVFDFIFKLYLIGNDFLPRIPSMDAVDETLENILSIGSETIINPDHSINRRAFLEFLTKLSECEDPLIQAKRKNKFTDPILEVSADSEEYKRKYKEAKFNEPIGSACQAYIEGLYWVFTYYTRGVLDWTWSYPYYYAPFISDLRDYVAGISRFNFKFSKDTKPHDSFLQLLSILPPSSKELLPSSLVEILDEDGVLKDLYHTEPIYVLEGKMRDYEGVIILPRIDFTRLAEEYEKRKRLINDEDKKRNQKGKVFLYQNGGISNIDF